MILLIKIIKALIFICILTIVYQLIDKLFSKFNKKVYEAMGRTSIINQKKKNTNLYKFIPDKLIKNRKINIKVAVLKTNILMYFLLKILLGFLSFYITKFNYNSVIIGTVGGVFGYKLIDILAVMRIKKENKYIRFIMSDIYDMLSCQLAAGTQLGQALTEVYELVEHERLKNALIEMTAEINLTKKIFEPINKLQEKFDSKELDMFCLTIKQSSRTGKSKKTINSLSKVLRNSNFAEMKEQTNRIAATLGMVSFLIFTSIMAIVFFSFGNQINSSLKNIFGIY